MTHLASRPVWAGYTTHMPSFSSSLDYSELDPPSNPSRLQPAEVSRAKFKVWVAAAVRYLSNYITPLSPSANPRQFASATRPAWPLLSQTQLQLGLEPATTIHHLSRQSLDIRPSPWPPRPPRRRLSRPRSRQLLPRTRSSIQ